MKKRRDITALILALTIVVLLNVMATFVFHRFDLTSEKRYTLSETTKKLLKKINDVVYVKVYLEGEFPAGFKRLRNETKEMLDEFRAYGNDNIEYEFINPFTGTDKAQQKDIIKQLYNKGLQPTNLEVKEDNGTSQQIVFPAALITYKGREMPWQLLKTQLGQSSEGQLNTSIQALEYEFANCIKNLSSGFKPKIGFVEGHGELDTLWVKDISESLKEYYDVHRVKINEQLIALDGYKTIIIAKPDTVFSEKDKFIIDQFVMKGGKILWAVDALNTSVDSLSIRGNTIAIPYNLNLDDMLFKYGVRINPNIVLDIQCSAVPVNKALRGQTPRYELMPWIFNPLIIPSDKHPISKNLDILKMDYCSSIDTVAAKGISKSVLLSTSKYSKTLTSPVRVDLNYLRYQPDETQFRNSFQTTAVLLEGRFESVFKNRIPPAIAHDSAIAFKEQSILTQMIVISDGDILRNDVQHSSGKPYPLGYDKYTNQTYGNKNFMLNCINYLCDDSGLLSVRTRELTLRLLDKKKARLERLKWQLINTLVPLGLILLFGIVYSYRRKRKYS